MATVTGQATDPVSPGVLGEPMDLQLPTGFPAIGVKGDGGTGFPSPIPLDPGLARQGIGVLGTTADPNGAGIMGANTAGGLAGNFQGNIAVFGSITVTGDVVLSGADCAEDFTIVTGELAPPGTVMVIDENGALRTSYQVYDRRVAGVISGAGDYKPAIVMDKREGERARVALMGKVFCKVDAEYGSIEVGDLLTTSATPGHAMKAGEPLQAFGAVIGKALRPLKDGQGLIPILIALQ